MRKLPLQCFGADFACLQLPSLQDTTVLVEIMPPKASKKQKKLSKQQKVKHMYGAMMK